MQRKNHELAKMDKRLDARPTVNMSRHSILEKKRQSNYCNLIFCETTAIVRG